MFHSFRHRFKGVCRASGISEDIPETLTGYSLGRVGRAYGRQYSLVALKNAIDKFDLKVIPPVNLVANLPRKSDESFRI